MRTTSLLADGENLRLGIFLGLLFLWNVPLLWLKSRMIRDVNRHLHGEDQFDPWKGGGRGIWLGDLRRRHREFYPQSLLRTYYGLSVLGGALWMIFGFMVFR